MTYKICVYGLVVSQLLAIGFCAPVGTADIKVEIVAETAKSIDVASVDLIGSSSNLEAIVKVSAFSRNEMFERFLVLIKLICDGICANIFLKTYFIFNGNSKY